MNQTPHNEESLQTNWWPWLTALSCLLAWATWFVLLFLVAASWLGEQTTIYFGFVLLLLPLAGMGSVYAGVKHLRSHARASGFETFVVVTSMLLTMIPVLHVVLACCAVLSGSSR